MIPMLEKEKIKYFKKITLIDKLHKGFNKH